MLATGPARARRHERKERSGEDVCDAVHGETRMNFKPTLMAGTALASLGAAGAAEAGSTMCADTGFSFTGSLTYCMVGAPGEFRITAYGAQGGSSNRAEGGEGAFARGDFDLAAGTMLQILVGGAGQSSSLVGGGGGGTFVARGPDNATALPMVVAGGGGGAYDGASGGNATTLPSGSGAGGEVEDPLSTLGGGGGGGFRTGGESGSFPGGYAFVNGGAGGAGAEADGGFGGGGSGESGGGGGGGGGGGYSGGDGGYYGGGQGGTSFVAEFANASLFEAEARYADGYLRIERLSTAPSEVPLPGAGGLIAAGLAGLAAMRAAKRKPKG